MPFSRPSLDTLIGQIAADIQSRLPGTDPLLRRALLTVLGRVHAGGVDGLYGYLDFLSRQIFPDTAELAYLTRWASFWGINRKQPFAGLGGTGALGNNGAIIPAGTIVQRSDGQQYSVFAQVTIAAGIAVPVVTALVPGSAGNCAAGTQLTFVTPISGVNTVLTVDGFGIGGGADTETDPQLLKRLLARVQTPPAAGALYDYVNWALAVPGVTQAWGAPQWQGAGTVGVFFLFNGAIPNGATVTVVQNAINALAPVTDAPIVLAPVAYNVLPTIHITPDNVTTRAAVTAALAAQFAAEATPRGVTLPAGSLPDGTIYLSRFRRTISDATGILDSVVTLPAADVVAAAGQIPTLGAITWV